MRQLNLQCYTNLSSGKLNPTDIIIKYEHSEKKKFNFDYMFNTIATTYCFNKFGPKFSIDENNKIIHNWTLVRISKKREYNNDTVLIELYLDDTIKITEYPKGTFNKNILKG